MTDLNPREPQVSVVLVSYQSRETIGRTLDALQRARESMGIRTIVVDNASSDGTADFVAEYHPWVSLVRGHENVGFGKGCNIALRDVASPYVLFLNPDAVCGLPALQAMLALMESRPSIGILGPAVVEASGQLQPSGALPTPWTVMWKPAFPGWASRGMRHVQPGELPRRTSWICGSVMLVRMSMVKEIGGFDPRFFLYFEESDLCARAHRAGWEVWTSGQAVCEHVNAASAKKTGDAMMWGTISDHYFRSRMYYMVKHHGWPAALVMEAGELVLMCARAVIERTRGRPYPTLAGRLRAPKFRLPAPAQVAVAATSARNGTR
ncbi:glycosyltransferase family 2 protein [Thioalkalivibrio sp. XN8]|uniref:glycosyltransferase family 2 protein n=1 Tax=Thioalkalivibrio sp. XN8 TaxID=2712863 RepID=UPI0013EA8AF1|nr:glycosyltransferase family 2 protein [Thioalkalivibrio sp. XN8]NGP53693.1 glycosyltransferase family 2 protein [Thioalkalivibrio sp. XN8]